MFSKLLNLLAPEDCLSCGKEGSLWCEWCRLSDPSLPSRCFLCHTATDNFEVCHSCRKRTSARRVYICKEYKEYPKELINCLKFKSKRHSATPIARCMVDTLPYYPSTTIVVNVPTSPSRVRQRGFDHTQQLAKQVARQKKLTYQNVLAKTDNTRQVGSTKKQREEQAKHAYRIKKHTFSKKNILLIDDVVTTGATISELTKLLKKAGAKSVDVAAFAYSK